ncbi:RING finger and CHY zinc finger domain-containing protein [Endozoicomonas sp. ALC020]|uniref:RING finger and CHY zinc finger domain-containing protein n=1 Tax=unclassified Endozoicomonas TaxID=2644528 RepID=UPI003BB055D2
MRFYRFFLAFVLLLLALAVLPLCYCATIIDQNNHDGHRVRIEINDDTDLQRASLWQVSLLLPEGFNNRKSSLCFMAPVVPAGSNSIPLLTTNDPVDYCYQLTEKQTHVFQDVSKHASENGTLVRLKLTTEDRPESAFITTNQSLKPHTTSHREGLKAGNGGGEPSGKVSDKAPKDESNDHQKEKKGEPGDKGSDSPGESNYGSEEGNNRKDGNGKESAKNTWTQDLQLIANQLVALIESDDPDAVFMLRQILDELNMPQRLQVLETKSTNTSGNTVTPLEAILKLQRSFYENSTRNRFIEQLIEATSDQTRTLDDFNILSELQPIIATDRSMPEANDNNLMILYKIVQDFINRFNQSDQQPSIGHFEKSCFTEYFVQLLLLYSNPVESIRELLGKMSDSVIRHDIMNSAQSLTFSTPFHAILIQLEQHPSFHELEGLSNELIRQAPGSHLHNEEATPSGAELTTRVQKTRERLCEHYNRLCRVNFKCCGLYFPCHKCHNESDKCKVTDCRAVDATWLLCSVCGYEGTITENSQTCPNCNEQMSQYFCAICKHFTDTEKEPYHCDKCGICRVEKDGSYHCDVCNTCLQDVHKCRENAGHDDCGICMEDVFRGGKVLPCSHIVHHECAIAMIQNEIRTCPVCRYPLYSPLDENNN